MMKKYMFLGAALLASTGLYAQADDLKYCGTTEQREKLEDLFEDFELQDSIDQAEFQVYYENYLKSLNTSSAERSTYVIPMVVHIVHLDGSENISDAQVYDAVSILNEDFNAMNSDLSSVVSQFQGVIGNGDIEFRLATKDPDGNCHKGITRTYSQNTYDTGMTFNGHPIVEDVRAEHGTWPQNMYMNVFVCIDPDGAAGYTLTPSGWLPENDMYGGILISHNYMGSIGTGNPNLARALTHEVGHWLNLSHTWGPNNNPGNAASCSDDDGVSDTPNTIGWTSCNLNGNTCNSDDNVQNYMEYSYCSRMFTQGQVTRMHAALNNSTAGRDNLWTNANLIATGTDNPNPGLCEADFTVSETVICEGGTIDFTDGSFHNVNSWNWTINGGTPSTSTDQNPSGIVFDTPGTYDISLTASDGSSNATETKVGLITVLPNDAIPFPYSEGFESVSSLPTNDLFLNNPDGGTAWTVTTDAALGGTKSVRIGNNSANAGNVDEFISNTFNLKYLQSVTLSFDYAFAQRNNLNNDGLKIYVSKDCGESWSMRKNMTGSTLATRNPTASNFVPTASEWAHVDITNISASYLVEAFRFKFEFTSDGGNNIYVDNINLTGIMDVNIHNGADYNIAVYPNPANEFAKIDLEVEGNKNVSIEVTDLLGRKVTDIHNGAITGMQTYTWNTSGVAKGTYLINVIVDGERITKKLIVE